VFVGSCRKDNILCKIGENVGKVSRVSKNNKAAPEMTILKSKLIKYSQSTF
jgi:hypothetical protein